MNAMTLLLAAGSLVPAAVLALYWRRHRSAAPGRGAFTVVFAGVIVALSAAGYAKLGHWSDWDVREVDRDVGYLMTAEIGQAQRRVKMAPKSAPAQVALAEAQLKAGLYAQALEAYREALELAGPSADLYGRIAYAAYYRDGRRMSPEAQAAADQALALNKLEVRTRMLLGQDAFLNARYSEAIAQWRLLLDSQAAPAQERALRNAIANAESRARQQD